MTESVSSPKRRIPARERRRLILESSTNVFAEKGFSGASTKELALAAGISEALLFRHFTSKEALYAEILERFTTIEHNVLEHLENREPNLDTLVLLFYHLIHNLHGMTEDSGENKMSQQKVLMQELLLSGPFGTTFQQLHIRPLLPIVTKLINHLRETGELKKTHLHPSEILGYGFDLAIGSIISGFQPESVIESGSHKQLRNLIRYMLAGAGLTRKQIQHIDWTVIRKIYNEWTLR